MRGGFDPLRFTWQLLCNVKFALFLVGLAGIAGMIGVVVPQMPIPMRGNPAARQAWLELQHNDFGAFATPMERLGLSSRSSTRRGSTASGSSSSSPSPSAP